MGTYELKTALLKKIEECEQKLLGIKPEEDIANYMIENSIKLAYLDCIRMLDEHCIVEDSPSD